MKDIRHHIRALLARREIAIQLAGRPDIVQLAEMLVARQDGRATSHDAGLASSQGAMPLAEELAGGLIPVAEFDAAAGDGGLAVPAGVRHAMLQFSPILQLAALDVPDRRVGGIIIEELPTDGLSLLAWLSASIGLPGRFASPVDVAVADLAELAEADMARAAAQADDIALSKAFARRFGFNLAGYADFLIALRGHDPVSYVLILSREFGLARLRLPELDRLGGLDAARYMPALKKTPIQAAMTIAELQRLAVMTRALYRMGGRTGTETIRHMMPGGEADFVPGYVDDQTRAEASAAISLGLGAGRVLDEAPLHAAGIRRLFRMRKQDLIALDVNNVIAALLDGRLDWNSAASVRTQGGWRQHAGSQIDADIHRKRRSARGIRHLDDPLDLYYGVRASTLPALATLELGRALVDKALKDDTELLSAAIAASLFGERPDSGQYGVKLARPQMAIYLPRTGRPGSAGRFQARLWLDRHQDEGLFRRLARPVDASERKIGRTAQRRTMLAALWFLQVCFVRLYRRAGALATETEMCDLATSVSVLTSDPLMVSLMGPTLRRMAHGNKQRHGRRTSNLAAVTRVLTDAPERSADAGRSPDQTNL